MTVAVSGIRVGIPAGWKEWPVEGRFVILADAPELSFRPSGIPCPYCGHILDSVGGVNIGRDVVRVKYQLSERVTLADPAPSGYRLLACAPSRGGCKNSFTLPPEEP